MNKHRERFAADRPVHRHKKSTHRSVKINFQLHQLHVFDAHDVAPVKAICRVGQKSGVTNSWPYFCQILTDLKKITGRFLGKFAVKWVLKIPPHRVFVATLPCENLMSTKQATNDKLQGNAATYLRYGEVFNNQIKKSLLLLMTLWVKKC